MEGNGVDAPRLSAARLEFQSNGAHQLLNENPREEVTVPKSSMLSAPEQHGDGDVVQDIYALGAAAQVLRDCSAAGAQEAAPMGRDTPIERIVRWTDSRKAVAPLLRRLDDLSPHVLSQQSVHRTRPDVDCCLT